jgi:transposase
MTRARKLTDAQVSEIRDAYQYRRPGFGYSALAKKYGVGASTIRDALTGRTAY